MVLESATPRIVVAVQRRDNHVPPFRVQETVNGRSIDNDANTNSSPDCDIRDCGQLTILGLRDERDLGHRGCIHIGVKTDRDGLAKLSSECAQDIRAPPAGFRSSRDGAVRPGVFAEVHRPERSDAEGSESSGDVEWGLLFFEEFHNRFQRCFRRGCRRFESGDDFGRRTEFRYGCYARCPTKLDTSRKTSRHVARHEMVTQCLPRLRAHERAESSREEGPISNPDNHIR